MRQHSNRKMFLFWACMICEIDNLLSLFHIQSLILPFLFEMARAPSANSLVPLISAFQPCMASLGRQKLQLTDVKLLRTA